MVIGLALVGAGAFTTVTSQNTINYCHTLIKTLACGEVTHGTAQPRFFMSPASAVSLQDAELAWALGLVTLVLGAVIAAYGVYSEIKAEPVPSPAA